MSQDDLMWTYLTGLLFIAAACLIILIIEVPTYDKDNYNAAEKRRVITYSSAGLLASPFWFLIVPVILAFYIYKGFHRVYGIVVKGE